MNLFIFEIKGTPDRIVRKEVPSEEGGYFWDMLSLHTDYSFCHLSDIID